jgi:hypothetical protein
MYTNVNVFDNINDYLNQRSIGALNYLRIWHDNSGKGRMASWYLNHVVVRDVQTDKKYYFIANRWFAVEEDDGQV